MQDPDDLIRAFVINTTPHVWLLPTEPRVRNCAGCGSRRYVRSGQSSGPGADDLDWLDDLRTRALQGMTLQCVNCGADWPAVDVVRSDGVNYRRMHRQLSRGPTKNSWLTFPFIVPHPTRPADRGGAAEDCTTLTVEIGLVLAEMGLYPTRLETARAQLKNARARAPQMRLDDEALIRFAQLARSVHLLARFGETADARYWRYPVRLLVARAVLGASLAELAAFANEQGWPTWRPERGTTWTWTRARDVIDRARAEFQRRYEIRTGSARLVEHSYTLSNSGAGHNSSRAYAPKLPKTAKKIVRAVRSSFGPSSK